MKNAIFLFGNWQVSQASNSLECGNVRHQMEPRAMDVLVALCCSADSVMSSEQLQIACWGSTLYGDNPVHKSITQLRRLLGDSANAPTYIETIRKRGYRAIAPIHFNSATAIAPDKHWHGASPFRGLQAFDADHAAVFFGRDEAINALEQALAQQIATQRALLLVLGASGSGKTSLIRAGLLPRLEQRGKVSSSASLDLGELSAGQLFAGLAGAMLDWQLDGAALFPGASAFSLGQRIEQQLTAVISELSAALAGQIAPAKLLLFLDRFEAVFTLAHISPDQRQQLMAVIDVLASSGSVIVLLACRNDFYPHVAAFPVLMAGKASHGHFDLSPPSPAEIAQIIRLPAQAAQLSFGTDPLTQARLDDTLYLSACASPDALPLLQYTLHELYRLRSSEGELSIEAYQGLGGLDGAIGSRAEEVIATLSEPHRAALPRVLSLVVTLAAGSDAATSRRAPYAALQGPMEHELVNALVEARLFISALVGGSAGFGVAHESLLRRWDRVRDWIAAHRHSLHSHSRITQLTGRWLAEGRADDLLLPHGKQLAEARLLLSTSALSLSHEEMALIAASQRKAQRSDRLRLGALVLMLTLAVLALIFGASAFNAKRIALQRQVQAESLMGFMLGDFADKLRPLGRLDLLDSVSSKALAYLASSKDDALSDTSLTHRAKALEVIGEVRTTRGDPEGANQALLAGNAILRQQLQRRPDAADVLKQLGANAFWLGHNHLDQNDWQGAQQFFLQYLAFSNQLSALAPDNVDAWIEQSYAHNSLGSLAISRGDTRTANAEFSISIALKTKALAHQPHNHELTANLADSLSWAGFNHETRGELEAAHGLYQRELALANALHQAAPNDLLWLLNLAVAYHHQAALKQVRGLDQQAYAAYEAASSALQQIVHDEPANRGAQRNLLIAQLQMLSIQHQNKQASALEPLLVLSKKISALAKRDPRNADWTRLDALALKRVGASWLLHGRTVEAKSSIEAALLRLTALHASDPSNQQTSSVLASALLAQSDMRRDGLDCQSVITLLGAATAASTDYQLLDPWVRAHRCLGQAVPAEEARLQQIGYREDAYLKYLSHHPGKLP